MDCNFSHVFYIYFCIFPNHCRFSWFYDENFFVAFLALGTNMFRWTQIKLETQLNTAPVQSWFIVKLTINSLFHLTFKYKIKFLFNIIETYMLKWFNMDIQDFQLFREMQTHLYCVHDKWIYICDFHHRNFCHVDDFLHHHKSVMDNCSLCSNRYWTNQRNSLALHSHFAERQLIKLSMNIVSKTFLSTWIAFVVFGGSLFEIMIDFRPHL